MKEVKNTRLEWLRKELNEGFGQKDTQVSNLIDMANKLYEKGYSARDIFDLLETSKITSDHLTTVKKYELLVTFNKVKKEFRNEKVLMLFIFNFIYLDKVLVLENISFM